MALSAKLCNPTPFPVRLRWHKGIDIMIPPMGDTTLSPIQMEDFRPGKPGSATVQQEIEIYGIFLYDTDRDYDEQALEALQRCLRARKIRYEEAVKSMRDRRAAEGSAPSEELLEQLIVSFGFDKQRDQIAILEKQVKELQKVVSSRQTKTEDIEFDPLTVYVLDPPRKFPSEAQLNFFLDLPGNEQIKAQHQAMVQNYLNSKAKPKSKAEVKIEQPIIPEEDIPIQEEIETIKKSRGRPRKEGVALE